MTENEGGQRNWKLLTNVVFNQDKYERLRNHIKVRGLRQEKRGQEENKKNKK